MSAGQPYIPGLESAERRLDLSQWYTPAWLAYRLWKWAAPRTGESVLEPAAGRGALLAPMLSCGAFRRIVAYDVDPLNVAALRALRESQLQSRAWAFEVREADFLASAPERFDLAIVNTPYEHGQDCAFVSHALECCDRVVGIFRSAMLHAEGRRAFWESVQPTRIAFLLSRPQFAANDDSGARSDFIAMELVRGARAGKPASAALEWW